MSKIKTAALSAAAVIGLAVLAGAQTPAKPDAGNRGVDRGGRHGQMNGMRRGGMRRERGRFGGEGHLMKDLNLTDAQKSTIKAIHEKYKPQFKSLREQGRTQFESLRGARQKGDTTAAARQRIRQQREQLRQRADAIRTQERNEVRAVLTAEQRAKWDAAAKQRDDRFKQRQDRMKNRQGKRIRA